MSGGRAEPRTSCHLRLRGDSAIGGRAGLASLGVIAIASVGFWWRAPVDRKPDTFLNAVPLTSYRGHEIFPDLSPDGSRLAFSWDAVQQQKSDIYIKKLGDSGAPLRLTSDPHQDFGPSWSPYAASLAFIRRLPHGDEVLVVSPFGGSPERKLAEIFLRQVSFWGPTGAGHILTWSPDGHWLALATADSPVAVSRLVLVSANTGETRVLTQPEPRSRGISPHPFLLTAAV